MKNLLLAVLLICFITGCNNENGGDSKITHSPSNNSQEKLNTPTLPASESPGTINQNKDTSPTVEPEVTPTPSESTNTPLELKSNEYDPATIAEGDVIEGLTAVSVVRDAVGPGSLRIEFSGEVKLSGDFKYYTREETTIEAYEVYLTLDEDSMTHFPLWAGTNTKFPLRLGIANASNYSELFGKAGTSGKLSGTFDHVILEYIPGKPAESQMDIVKGEVVK